MGEAALIYALVMLAGDESPYITGVYFDQNKCAVALVEMMNAEQNHTAHPSRRYCVPAVVSDKVREAMRTAPEQAEDSAMMHAKSITKLASRVRSSDMGEFYGLKLKIAEALEAYAIVFHHKDHQP